MSSSLGAPSAKSVDRGTLDDPEHELDRILRLRSDARHLVAEDALCALEKRLASALADAPQTAA